MNQRNSTSQSPRPRVPASPRLRLPALKNLLLRLHRDDHGNIAILVILAAMLFVGMLALVWNAGEYAVRKQRIQIAADSAANAVEVQRARTVNLISASNMVMGENASAEIMFRTIQAVYQNVSNHLNGEQQNVANRIQQIDAQRLADSKKPGGPNPNQQYMWGLEESVLAMVQQTIPLEQNEIADYNSITQSAYNSMVADDFQPRRLQIVDYQHQVIDMLPQTVQSQIVAIADGNKCDITLAVTGDRTNDLNFGSAQITPPLKEVQYVNVEPIVHQGVDLPDPVVQGNVVHIGGGDWGRIDDPPLARFVNDRVARDSNGQARLLVNLLQQIDNERAALGQQMLNYLNNAGNRQLALQVEQAVMGIGQVGPWWNPNEVFNGWAYHSPFAVATWSSTLAGMTHTVLYAMGDDPQIALITYDRYEIPQWAQPQVRQSAYQNVYNDVYGRNLTGVMLHLYQELEQQATKPITGQQEGQIRQLAMQLARPLTQQGAAWIADDVSTQWIAQTWPYEIFPPQTPNPMPPGIRTEDRLTFYTVVAGARATDQTTAKPLLPKSFPNDPNQQLVAYAQAETFNWMEYNGGYGASDVYTTWFPPAPWRVSTRGGWSWNPRLSFADGLPGAMANNPEFREYMDSAGVKNYDAPPLQTLNQH